MNLQIHSEGHPLVYSLPVRLNIRQFLLNLLETKENP